MYHRTIPRYQCVNGVWAPDIVDGKSFTKNDVKQIYMDRDLMCIYIILKDGTKICPDFVIADNETVLQERFIDWQMDILHLKRLIPHEQNPRYKYEVYDNWGTYIDETTAVSEAQAVNNVRFNWYGSSASNNDFFAIRIDHNQEADLNCWYAIEFSIAGNGESGFKQWKAQCEVRRASSAAEAKREVEYEFFKVNDDRCIFVNVCFGRVKGFPKEADALLAATKWKIKSKEEI